MTSPSALPWAPAADEPTGRDFVCDCGRLRPPGPCPGCGRPGLGAQLLDLVRPAPALAVLLALAVLVRLGQRVDWASAGELGRTLAGLAAVALVGTCTVLAAAVLAELGRREVTRSTWPTYYSAPT